MKRIQEKIIFKDLKKKIVFIVGPRQVGKTYLAKEIQKSFKNSTYLNYDRFEDRKIIESESWLESCELLILDEIHKMKNWKNYLKGVYDTKPALLKILVTGSARLDTFRQSGDSLAGRYFVHRLLPFSPKELESTNYTNQVDRLIERGGFPEPFLAKDEVEAKRWRMQYIDGLIRTDILDFENIHNFKSIQLVFDLLRRKVGSPISYKSIAEDVGISPNTVKKYINIFESLFIIFKVVPYSNNIARSLLKEPKIYFFDTGLVNGDKGILLENMTAICLLKHVYGKVDCLGEYYNLHYLRTKERKEVDFCITKDNKIEFILEVKHNENDFSKSLAYFSNKYDLKGIQISKELKREKQKSLLILKKAENFYGTLFF